MSRATPSPLESLRRALRRQRAGLGRRRQRDSARRIAARFWRLALARNARRIAVYAAIGGEVSCTLLAREAWRRGRSVYLPVVCGKQLRFARWAPRGRLKRGRFGIPVPVTRAVTCAHRLHVVIAPLVAADRAGNRLGTGGGYYDRALARRRPPRSASRPLFIGAAHAFQHVEQLPAAAHDVPLDVLLLPDRTYRFTR